MGRAPCCDKGNVKKGPWSPEEDAKLKSYIQEYGTGGNWIALPQKMGLRRCGKSCRLRWLNYLRPNLKHGGFTEEEDNIICRLYMSIGSRWSIIAAQLPGRTDNDIKNYWNTRLKKKLVGRRGQSSTTNSALERLQLLHLHLQSPLSSSLCPIQTLNSIPQQLNCFPITAESDVNGFTQAEIDDLLNSMQPEFGCFKDANSTSQHQDLIMYGIPPYTMHQDLPLQFATAPL